MINRPIRYIILLFLSMFLLIAVCCDRHGEADSRMDKAESLMVSKPDSALMILDSITPDMLSGKRVKARYALLKSMALDKNYIDTTTFDVLQPAIDYFLKKGSADEKLRTYYYQGRIYQNRQNPDSAMQSFMRGREYGAQATDTMTLANLLVAQGTILYTTYKFDDFIKVNLDAAKLYNDIGKIDFEILSLVNALDGSIITSNRHLVDSIMSIARKKVGHNSELNAIINPYILIYTVKFGKEGDIKKIINRYKSTDEFDDETKVSIALAYSKIGDLDNARRFLEAIPISSKTRKSLEYLAAKSDVLEQSGDLSGALETYRDFYTTLSSIHQKIFSHDLLFAKERHEMEKSNLLRIQKRDRIIWISLCVVFLLLLIICYLYYRYRLGKAKNQVDDLEKKRLKLERENLRLKIKQLEDESSLLRDILEKRDDLAKPIEDAIKIRIEMLNGLLATQISKNDSYAKPYDEWSDRLTRDKDEFMNTTRLAFTATHPKVIGFLEEHGLTEYEINYMCLYALGLRGKEVGEYMQLKRHYHISSDIRKKLGIDEHQTNIGIYIRNLMEKL